MDLYYLSKHNNPLENEHLWTITDKEFNLLENCFSKYERKTGYQVDEYSDFELPAEALKPLIETAREALKSENRTEARQAIEKLIHILLDATRKKRGIGIYCD